MSVIRILHLSDLHFGDFNRFAGRDPRQLGKAFAADLETARKQIADVGQVDLVVVSGDVAERGKPKEFEAGRAFLEALAGELGVLPRRFVFVPGNHDVSWPECKRVEVDQEVEEFDAAELRRRTEAVKLKHYDDFLSHFYGKDLPAVVALDRGGQLYNLPELRLSVGALNSCERETHKVHGGLVSQEQAQSLLDAWLEEPCRDWLKVVVVHHNPDLTTHNSLSWWIDKLKDGGTDPSLVEAYFSDICGFEGAEHLKRVVADARVQLLLHGHQHAEDRKVWLWRSSGQALVLSTGSLGLSDKHLPKDEPLSCRLIRLDTEAREIDARRLVFTGWARTEGHLYRGAFTLDSAEPDGLRQGLHLPSAWGISDGSVRKGAGTPAAPDITDLLKVYRDRMTNAGSSWSIIGVAQGVGTGRPLEGRLDDMYVELRFFKEFDPQERGQPILVEGLFKRKKPLLLRGAAGAGKTTWVRHTFRRLLEDERFVPILLVLRDLSRRWQGKEAPRGADRSIDSFLEESAAAEVGKGWAPRVGELLRLAEGPRPVLLVDGWDEIGELGEEVRRKLVGLMKELPRLLVIVTSRPYGKDKPSHAEGFETLDVQPLLDDEMKDLGARFFRLCHPQDESAARKEAESFEKALAAAPEARGLARTPLFLTMMLMIGRAKPLPDKRHLLYEACIDNLLQAIPEKREREGATLLVDQWRPDDSQERWRVVARLAFEVQSQGFQKSVRGVIIVRTQDELVTMLPPEWQVRDRRRFLAWLAGPAGILTDRTDGSYQFSHLSFQEFLAAWHLDSAREGAHRASAFVEFAASEAWWETLQLWAALVDRKNPQLLNEPLAALIDIEDGTGLSLAGMILADGSAPVEALEKWARMLVRRLDRPAGIARCLQTWSASAQEERKALLGSVLTTEGKDLSWAVWYRAEAFCQACGQAAPPVPTKKVISRAAIEQVEIEGAWDWSAAHLAASRLHWSRGPLWPLQPQYSGLLSLWPSPRRWLGAHLQSLVVHCPVVRLPSLRMDAFAPRADLIEVASDLARYFASDFAGNFTSDFQRYFTRDLARYLASDLVGHFVRHLAGDSSRDSARDFVSYLAGDFVRDLARYFVRDFARYFVRYFARDFVRDLARNFVRYFTRDFDSAHYFAREVAPRLGGRLGIEHSTPGFFSFAEMELMAIGRAAGRFSMAVLDPEKETGIPRLFCQASQLSFRPNTNPRPFEAALAEIGPTLPDLWPALAKHITRRSTPEDRALLRDYAEHPEKAGAPLCWGLQFFVRGDVMLEDGSIVTLDELYANSGLPPLPLLEDMPPELVVQARRKPRRPSPGS